MNFSDDTLYQALQVFISVTHLWVPRIRESYSISDSFFFFLTKQQKTGCYRYLKEFRVLPILSRKKMTIASKLRIRCGSSSYHNGVY